MIDTVPLPEKPVPISRRIGFAIGVMLLMGGWGLTWYAAGIMLMTVGAGVTAFYLPLPQSWK